MNTTRPEHLRYRLLLFCILVGACERNPQEQQDLPFSTMAARIASALAPQSGERAMVRYDPALFAELAASVEGFLRHTGVDVERIPYGETQDYAARLNETDIYIWLPASMLQPHPPDQLAALGEWLNAGRGRQIHFHWGQGTIGTDGIAGEHSPVYDSIYVTALDIDYDALNNSQEAAMTLLQSGLVHITTPAGTDIRFTVGDRPFNLQNGDASNERMATARVRIDRDIELPAGVIRVAPLEETVVGTLVVPYARFGEAEATDVRLRFEQGRVTEMSAATGEQAVRDAISSTPALSQFREFGLGFNPKLVTPPGHQWLPYFGYGAGIVRLSLGDNTELGGNVTGGGVRWFFFPHATVMVGERILVQDGRLLAISN